LTGQRGHETDRAMMMRFAKRTPAVLCATAAMLGAAITAIQAQQAVVGPVAANDPAEIKRRAQTTVTFKDGRITIGDIENELMRLTPLMRARNLEDEVIEDFMDDMLREELLAREAARRGIDKTDSVREAVKQKAVQSMLKAEFDDKQTPQSIPKADVEAYYKQHIDEYVQPALQRAGQIVVATEKEANDLLAQAKSADLRAFHQLARDKSIDEAGRARGGDLHYFDASGKVHDETAADVPLPLVKAAFALKSIGDIAPKPIKTELGYSVLKLTGARPAVSRKIADVEESIRVRLWRERRQQGIDALVGALREKYKPEIHAELVDAIVLDRPPELPTDSIP
jgi:peptidyl-prolyl cis-trans isomerase C